MKLNIIIPMAGESSRFNYKFKPFMLLDNKTFIEHVLDSFIDYDDIINSYNFIVTEKQQQDNNVLYILKNKLFIDLQYKINVIVIPKTTNGPYQTVSEAFSIINKMENIVICDSDHSLNIKPIIEKINLHPDIIIPLWNIKYEEHKNWGKIILEDDNIKRICEKEVIEKNLNECVYGMIGCYYFKSTDIFIKNDKYFNISDFLNENYKNFNINLVSIKKAYFFGTPQMVKETIQKRRKFETILCDVDGELLKHSNHSNDIIEDNTLLGNCTEQLQKWRENNKKIILVTARPKKTKSTFEKLLKELNIIYDDIVMGVNSGPRYLINDIKPSNPFVKQAITYNILRNSGIDTIKCNESDNYDIEIIKKFKGNSFTSTYLLKKNDQYFVRKYIIKNKKNMEHYDKLKRQCEDLKRFYYYNSNLVPKVLNENDNNFDYYIDLEYLENHKQLDEYDKCIQYKVLNKLLNELSENVYCYKKINNNTKFIEEFFNTKIYPKLKQFESECEVMNYLINNETVSINGKSYYGLRKIFERLDIKNFNTEWINPIHGDLTLENVLYDEVTDDIKLIDMDGSRYVDSCYFDLGKIFQSIVSNYKEWNNIEKVIINNNINNDINNIQCIDKYFDCDFKNYESICRKYGEIMNNNDMKNVFCKGIFYMSTYFIRFVQFRRQISNDHGIFAIIMAINWLNSIDLF